MTSLSKTKSADKDGWKRYILTIKISLKVEIKRLSESSPFAEWIFFFPFSPGRWRGEEIITWDRRWEGNKHTCECARSSTSVLQSLSRHPSGEKVWQGQTDKGRRERQRKEEIEGEIYMQQLTGVRVNLLLITATLNKLDWWCWEATRVSSKGDFLREQTHHCLSTLMTQDYFCLTAAWGGWQWGGGWAPAEICAVIPHRQTAGRTNPRTHTHTSKQATGSYTKACGYKSAET